MIHHEKYKIYFEDKQIKDAFDQLLKFDCLECLKATKKNENKSEPVTCLKNERRKPAGGQAEDKRQTPIDTPSAEMTNDEAKCQLKEPRENAKAEERIQEDGQGLLKLSDVILKNASFPDVFALRNHLDFKHRLGLCDLCLTHNKLFPFEYSYYNPAALRKHMKEGEPKTSHRGHPDCLLCHQTFFNNDELIRHMSREHFHCHFCGNVESNMRIYFLDYPSLREHFKLRHFLCERDNCRYEQFTSAFDNRIDYQLHLVQVHESSRGNLSRGEARQQRTIVLDPAPLRSRPGASPNRFLRQNLPQNAAIVTTGNLATANSSRQMRAPEAIREQLRSQAPLPPSEFPALHGGATSMHQPVVRQHSVQVSSASQFPTLGQSMRTRTPIPPSDTPLSRRLTAGPSSSSQTFNRALGAGMKPPDQLNEADFPPLPEQPKPKLNKKSKNANNSSSSRNEDLTLEQLISSSLTLSGRNKANVRKSNTKKGPAKKASKPLRIQLN